MKTTEFQQNYVTVWIWYRIHRLVCLHTGSSDTGPVRRNFRTFRYGDQLVEAWVVTIWRLTLASSSVLHPLTPSSATPYSAASVNSLCHVSSPPWTLLYLRWDDSLPPTETTNQNKPWYFWAVMFTECFLSSYFSIFWIVNIYFIISKI